MSQNLVNALKPRAQAVAEILAERFEVEEWEGYTRDEELIGRLKRPADMGYAAMVEYQRKGHSDAKISFAFLTMKDIKTKEIETESVSDEIIEKKSIRIKLPAGVTDKRTYTHSFETTESFGEAFESAVKDAFEVGAKVGLNASFYGVGLTAEVSSKYAHEQANKSTKSHNYSTKTSDTVSQELTLTGPLDTLLEFYRSRKKISQVVKAKADFDCKIFFQDKNRAVAEYYPYWTQWVPLCRGLADDSVLAYDTFINNPPTDKQIQAIIAEPKGEIEFVVNFDNIDEEHIGEPTD